jgi:hypothetical protein
LKNLKVYTSPSESYASLLHAKFMEKLKDEEEATLAAAPEKKERRLEGLLPPDSPDLKKIVRANQHGPLDAYFPKK